MEQRCNTDWVNERAITVQFDNQNMGVFESIASFLIIRPKYAWLGFGAGIVPPKWNDAFRWDVGLPKGGCSQSSPGVSNASGATARRRWTAARTVVTYRAILTTRNAGSCQSRHCHQHLHCRHHHLSRHLPPRRPVPPAGHGWSPSHNCTSCQGVPKVKPLVLKAGVPFAQCEALCVATPECRYMSYVEPEMPSSQCSLWADCAELCLTDHCWHWWVERTSTFLEQAVRRTGTRRHVTHCRKHPSNRPPAGLGIQKQYEIKQSRLATSMRTAAFFGLPRRSAEWAARPIRD
jgi:hypothetical protein